jgi:hypothetical protein
VLRNRHVVLEAFVLGELFLWNTIGSSLDIVGCRIWAAVPCQLTVRLRGLRTVYSAVGPGNVRRTASGNGAGVLAGAPRFVLFGTHTQNFGSERKLIFYLPAV